MSHYFNLHIVVPEAFILGSGEYHIGESSTISLVCIIENVSNNTHTPEKRLKETKSRASCSLLRSCLSHLILGILFPIKAIAAAAALALLDLIFLAMKTAVYSSGGALSE